MRDGQCHVHELNRLETALLTTAKAVGLDSTHHDDRSRKHVHWNTPAGLEKSDDTVLVGTEGRPADGQDTKDPPKLTHEGRRVLVRARWPSRRNVLRSHARATL